MKDFTSTRIDGQEAGRGVFATMKKPSLFGTPSAKVADHRPDVTADASAKSV
jgi:hypothetical protein